MVCFHSVKSLHCQIRSFTEREFSCINIILHCLKDKIKIKRDSVIKQQKVSSNHTKGCFQSNTQGFSYMINIFDARRLLCKILFLLC